MNITVGAIVLAGTYYYKVTDVFPRKFRAHVWDERSKAWGEHTWDVPNPSPTTSIQVLSADEVNTLFPSEA